MVGDTIAAFAGVHQSQPGVPVVSELMWRVAPERRLLGPNLLNEASIQFQGRDGRSTCRRSAE